MKSIWIREENGISFSDYFFFLLPTTTEKKYGIGRGSGKGLAEGDRRGLFFFFRAKHTVVFVVITLQFFFLFFSSSSSLVIRNTNTGTHANTQLTNRRTRTTRTQKRHAQTCQSNEWTNIETRGQGLGNSRGKKMRGVFRSWLEGLQVPNCKIGTKC